MFKAASVMTSGFKTYFYFLILIKKFKDKKQLIEPILVINESKRMTNDFTIMIMNEAVMLVFSNIDTN